MNNKGYTMDFDPISELNRIKRKLSHEIQNMCSQHGLTVGESMEVLDRARTSILSTTTVSLIHERR